MPELSFDQLIGLLKERGGAQYGGEAVTQLQHALQTAHKAESAGATAELIAAALFHDLGHLVHDLGEGAAAEGVDDRHEHRAIGWLRPVFDETVWQAVRLHVDAKRFLCSVEPGYCQALSEESRRSLQLQGGAMTAAEADAFTQQAYARDALELRRWDDEAKDPDARTPGLAYFAERIRALARQPDTAANVTKEISNER